MDVLSLLDGLNRKSLAPVYLLHGPERFIINLVVERLRELTLEGPMADLNFVRRNAGEVSGTEISAQVREMPMMAQKRLLLVENGQKLGTKDLEALDRHFKTPEPQTCLVISADKFDLRRGPLAGANRRKLVHKADKLKERDIHGFVRLRTRARQVKFDQGAVAALTAAIGPDCTALDDAIERLGLFAGPDREVTRGDVHELVMQIRQRTIFELVDAIGNRQAQKAMVIVENLLAEREEPLRINTMLARHFRQLLNARIHLHLRTGREALPGILGAPEFVVKKLLAQTRRFKGAELERALSRISQTDLELKSSRRPRELVMEQAVLDLCLS